MTSPDHPPQSRTSFRLPYPKGFLRLIMRFPILLYRLRLGWLLGQRFLLLEHRGRRSGKPKHAVIEVVDHDPNDGSYVVAAAWGAQSDWFKNILATPGVHVTVSTNRFPATAERIPEHEAARHLRAYAERNPFAFNRLGSLLIGQSTRDTEEVVQAFATSIPFVKFSPIRSDGQGQ
jgi:deazaflavin-dependent oxidoreductase (nitroreductase family)